MATRSRDRIRFCLQLSSPRSVCFLISLRIWNRNNPQCYHSQHQFQSWIFIIMTCLVKTSLSLISHFEISHSHVSTSLYVPEHVSYFSSYIIFLPIYQYFTISSKRMIQNNCTQIVHITMNWHKKRERNVYITMITTQLTL